MLNRLARFMTEGVKQGYRRQRRWVSSGEGTVERKRFVERLSDEKLHLFSS